MLGTVQIKAERVWNPTVASRVRFNMQTLSSTNESTTSTRTESSSPTLSTCSYFAGYWRCCRIWKSRFPAPASLDNQCGQRLSVSPELSPHSPSSSTPILNWACHPRPQSAAEPGLVLLDRCRPHETIQRDAEMSRSLGGKPVCRPEWSSTMWYIYPPR